MSDSWRSEQERLAEKKLVNAIGRFRKAVDELIQAVAGLGPEYAAIVERETGHRRRGELFIVSRNKAQRKTPPCGRPSRLR